MNSEKAAKMSNRYFPLRTFCFSLIALLLMGCGPKTPTPTETPVPITPIEGSWTSVDDPVRIMVGGGMVTEIYWSASKMVYINSQYEMRQLSCGTSGSISVQADGTFTFQSEGMVAQGKFDTPTSGHIVATFTSCKARAMNAPMEMFPPIVTLEEPLISDTDIEPSE